MTKPKQPQPDHHLQTVDRAIRDHGYFITCVLGDEHVPGYCYTTGFLHVGHPELVSIGLDPSDVQFVFDRLYAEAKDGRPREIGRDAANEVAGTPIRLLPVPPRHFTDPDCLLLGFRYYYDHHPELVTGEHLFVQFVWPDRDRNFPWDDDVEWTVWRDQPILADGDEPQRKVPLDDLDLDDDEYDEFERDDIELDDFVSDDHLGCAVCRAEGVPPNRAERRRQQRERARRR